MEITIHQTDLKGPKGYTPRVCLTFSCFISTRKCVLAENDQVGIQALHDSEYECFYLKIICSVVCLFVVLWNCVRLSIWLLVHFKNKTLGAAVNRAVNST